MRYAPDHKDTTRTRLLEVGGALAKENGFGTTGVDKLMAAAGLTSGAFYAHFRSKGELLEALVDSELTRSLARFADKDDAGLLAALESYLSPNHVDRPAEGCAATSLTPEIARASEGARQTFEARMGDIHAAIAPHVADDGAAWALMAQVVGAVMLARAMASSEVRQAVLDGALANTRAMVAAAKDSQAAKAAEGSTESLSNQ